jgi:hypothetical protein
LAASRRALRAGALASSFPYRPFASHTAAVLYNIGEQIVMAAGEEPASLM